LKDANCWCRSDTIKRDHPEIKDININARAQANQFGAHGSIKSPS